jgi:hypothetical protein
MFSMAETAAIAKGWHVGLSAGLELRKVGKEACTQEKGIGSTGER